jgi:hypothetical protein
LKIVITKRVILKAGKKILKTGERLSAEEPKFAADLVLVNDGGRVAVADAVLVREPVGALVTAEGGAGIEVAEPLG